MPHSECFVNGVFYPSVTTIMSAAPKPWLQAWKDKWGILAIRKTKIASAVGTEFHRCVDGLLNTGTYTIIPPEVDGIAMPSTMRRVQGMMTSYEGWLASITGDLIETECKVISHAYVYSGTLDAVIKLGKTLYIVDWKTSSRIYPEMALQLSAYAEAYNEQTGSKIKTGLIVHVSKDRPYKLTTKEFKLGKRVFKEFLKLREMFDEIHEANVEVVE